MRIKNFLKHYINVNNYSFTIINSNNHKSLFDGNMEELYHNKISNKKAIGFTVQDNLVSFYI